MRALFTCVAVLVAGAGALGESAAVGPYEAGPVGKPATEIDRLVFARLERLGVQPANLCSDAVFLRRAFLDVVGTLPTEQEARQFLQSKDPNKRSALIDGLLKRDEFVTYWAMKWSDLLRVKAEFPVNLWPNAAQAYYRWIRASMAENMPYDRFVRELLTASGSNFRMAQVNFYRAVQSNEPQALAQMVAMTFMGARADKWPAAGLAGMAGFFSQVGYKSTAEWKEEIVFFDPRKPLSGPAVFPDGTSVRLDGTRDGREVFAGWLIDPKNPWFTANIVNRVWYWLLGRGIIHEVDDIRPDNPPSNPELLAYLQRELVTGRYDLRHIYRLILNSQTYQLSSIPRTQSPEAAANFAFYGLRRLDAEVLIDALCQITGTTERYSSAIPEPFTYIPDDHRSISLPDGSITSSFLDMFGRPPRDTGLGDERNNQVTATQRLHLLNSSHVQRKIEQSRKLWGVRRSRGAPREGVERMYLTILSRLPTTEELRAIGGYAGPGKASARNEVAVDLVWALINSDEFLYRH